MGEKAVILTADGLQKLEDELDELKSHRRGQVAERIKQAIDYGDISENSEYEDAKNEQAFVEGRIIQLEKMIRNAQVIEASNVQTDVVAIGSRVLLKDMDDDEEIEYMIVGSAEADPGKHRISNALPVGKALLGQRKGAVVEIQVPAGKIQYKVLDINK
ncbi:transcription elongation factor GreA [Heliophilum fasciatum]|uniref:Transcription elongation factor GreA n=1 Tax=Heliophilum fasciatum TaxID=35700 RepID=A0A4R2RXY7_9FIRM|nr:transcription elongation factor GreA [Heliophilum fasciatum]MCW2277100.1 transcription elongation factor GreA [Heliophilum fasciatum]TCP68374.1 transcription elongation factor GreA [Heliophilum fasciatum]